MNKTIKPTQNMSTRIVAEITGKNNAYETRMATRLARWTEIAEYFQGKTPTVRDNAKISPNSAELYKSCRAIANMKFRMLTGQTPFFELSPMDIIGHADERRIIKAEHYVNNQLELSNFKKGLHRTLYQKELYGTVAVHEQYEPLRGSFLGTKRYITTYRPVSMINCAFAIDTYDVEESGWVCLNDIQNRYVLNTLLSHDPNGVIYNRGAIEECLNAPAYSPRVNQWVMQRMAWQGYINGNFDNGIERSFYYGPLECMNDGEEYAVEVVNRKYIIRMEAYDGLRPVRVSTQNTIDIEPLGNGQGDIFRPLLGQLDDVRSYLLNTVAFAGANMFVKQKSYGEEDGELAIRNFGFLNMENPNIVPLAPMPSTVNELAAYEDRLTKQFRNASGASDVLQAVVSNESSTATEVSLAMNEAVRNLSVSSEMDAKPLVADHIKVILQNAQRYNTKPFTLTINKVPVVIEPNDLLIDLDVRVKTVTDQDFRPSRVRNLMNTLQILNTIPPQAMSGYKVNVAPTVIELVRLQNVPNFEETIQDISQQDLIRSRLINGVTNAPMQAVNVGTASENRLDTGRPSRAEERGLNRGTLSPNINSDVVSTPGGEVLGAPGDQSNTLQAIKSSSVRP